MTLEPIERQLAQFAQQLGEGWTIGFQFHGNVDGWTVSITHGARGVVMYESDPHWSLEVALNETIAKQKRIIRELER